MILRYSSLLLFCSLIVQVVPRHLGFSTLEHTNVTDPDAEDEASPHLGAIKVGLAAAFFFGVLTACGLPIILIDYLQKSDSTDLSAERHDGNHLNDPLFCHEPAPVYSDRSRNPAIQSDDESVNNNGVASRQLSIDEYGVQSPIPANMENTDLLTGHQVLPSGSSWTRRFQDRIYPTGLVESRGAIPPRRRTRGFLSRSRAEHKVLLRRWFSRCNCFAAGIFLSSGFMELYVDVEEAIEEAKAQLDITSEFPFAPFLTLIGFFLVLSIEQIVWSVRSSKHSIGANVQRKRSSTPDASPVDTPLSPQTSVDPITTPVKFLFNGDATHVPSHTVSVPNRLYTTSSRVSQYSGPSKQLNLSNRSVNFHSHHHSHLPHPQTLDSFGSILRVVLLLCAMSVHSLFEGLAVGLQSTVQHTVTLFSAILLHKLIIAAGIGVNLATTVTDKTGTQDEIDGNTTNNSDGVSCRTLCYQTIATLIFSSSSPIGVLIGLGLMQQQPSGVLLMTTATLQGLACGTFFFVVFCELLPQEFREGVGDRIGKLLFLIFGFGLVALYAFFMPH